ncbi:hypothetical protein PFDSM3638_08800 [Pyrococcus furiosus DSM 3638]|uniref:Uncharacterized protein n=2 Tax=Pyrococcus furiosus TaxID=2261 RepID=A0A5C0XRH1_PYRFU|nr:hypothetical protein [Pyrococcus furiosus]AFN04906.1 hypothetical protein PFC_09925 [Pyrococcus furiosus COM1]QEK79352.1 hypothetical protein PFDSM3638_08800 [Pyrococcus furiosus DSM 3638]
MVSRLEIFNTLEGIVVKKEIKYNSKIGEGVYSFITEKMKREVNPPKRIDVVGFAYGTPSLYLGTLKDLDTEEKFSALIKFDKNSELKREFISVAAKRMEKSSAYFVFHKTLSNILHSPQLEPGHRVGFWGIRIE